MTFQSLSPNLASGQNTASQLRGVSGISVFCGLHKCVFRCIGCLDSCQPLTNIREESD